MLRMVREKFRLEMQMSTKPTPSAEVIKQDINEMGRSASFNGLD
jgi:hypothetical protein